MFKWGSMIKYISIFIFTANSLFSTDLSMSALIRLDQGFIDYANRVIISRGTASIIQKTMPDDNSKSIEKNIKLSKGEAKSQAREHLLDLVKQVNFDNRTVGEIMGGDPLIESRVKSLVGSAYQQGEIEYLERNEVAIALAIKMSGLAEILVDANGHLSEDISHSNFLMTRNTIPKSERTSGIVIDARNIYHVPAMVPKIFNENDNLIYGPRHYTRSRSINRGPMGYAHSMKDGNVLRRVGKNPIIIKAISSEDKVNLTISNSDAEKLRDIEKKFGLLTNCKVLVLLK